jgi:DNA-binding MarR family transcriptional regulator
MSKRGDLENRAIRLIFEKGEEGILQLELWKKLNATSREVSKIALKLEAKNIIKRERELAGGRWTYRLFTTKKPVEVDSIRDVPCFMCEDIDRCVNSTEISPSNCIKLSRWLSSYGKPSQKELED